VCRSCCRCATASTSRRGTIPRPRRRCPRTCRRPRRRCPHPRPPRTARSVHGVLSASLVSPCRVRGWFLCCCRHCCSLRPVLAPDVVVACYRCVQLAHVYAYGGAVDAATVLRPRLVCVGLWQPG
jgi:hypothetical protein